MSAITVRAANGSGGLPLTLRLALRELRGGLGGFRVFVACMALGAAAIASVGSLSQAISDGLAREGRVILGGDLAFTLIHREASAEERAFLDRHGEVAAIATMRAMARTTDGRSSLVELKAVDRAYPLFGAMATEPQGALGDLLARRGDAFGAAVDPALLARLNLKLGDRLSVGAATFELKAAIRTEPDKLAGGIGFGPRLMVSEDALRATRLLQPGSLVRWHYRLRLPVTSGSERAAREVKAAAEQQLPKAGWEIRTHTNSSPQLERNIERFTQYLTLVGLTALLVGGVGVANSVKHYLDGRRDVIATMKSLGATGGRVFAVYFTEVLLLALIGIAIGLAIGAVLPFVLVAVLGPIVPLPLAAALHPAELLLATLYGLLTATAFALWPLGRAHDAPVSALFRDEVAPERRAPRKRYVAATGAAVTALIAVAVVAAYDRKIAAIFIVAAALVFAMLRLVALAVMFVARRLPRPRSTILRLAVTNIHRPGALTPTVVLSLGLGVALLVTVLEIDGNLRRQFTAALPEKAPSFFFLDIPTADAERFDAFVHAQAPRGKLDRAPMLRGRLVSAGGVRVEDMKATPNTQWVLQSDRGITYADEIPAGSRIIAGEWWPANYAGPPLVSFDYKIAEGLGLKLGDPVTVNVLGREVTARISNLRALDWQSLGINFVMVFSPNTFRGAPVAQIATLTFPDGGTVAEEVSLLKDLDATFPAVTAVRVKDALDAIGTLVMNLVLAVRGASAITLVAAALVLSGALAAGHRHRVYDAVILKTLGATRRQLVAAYALEYLLIGLVTAAVGVAAGSLAAWRVIVDVMTLPFAWQFAPAATAALAALAVTVAFGLIGTVTALNRKPAPVLRNL